MYAVDPNVCAHSYTYITGRFNERDLIDTYISRGMGYVFEQVCCFGDVFADLTDSDALLGCVASDWLHYFLPEGVLRDPSESHKIGYCEVWRSRYH